MRRFALLLTLLLVSPSPPGMAATVMLSDFFGRWYAVEVAAEGLQGLEPSDLAVVITPQERGFRMRWTRLTSKDGEITRQPVEASFETTARPGVYAYKQDKGSLLGRLFAAPATGNPLKGETLLWARMAGPALIVYSLSLDQDGGFSLNRTVRPFDKGLLAHEQTLRTEKGRIAIVKGKLQQDES